VLVACMGRFTGVLMLVVEICGLTLVLCARVIVIQVHIPVDDNKKAKGFAYVSFMFPEHAAKALAEMDGSIFQGKHLCCLELQAYQQSLLCTFYQSACIVYRSAFV